MTLNQLKTFLQALNKVNFQLENGMLIPLHAHVTEVGTITRNFIDCGGTIRKHEKVNIQLWASTDYDHRLAPQKFLDIIGLSEKTLEINPDLEVEIEYQQETINKYGLNFNGTNFVLVKTLTDCLAPSSCGLPQDKPKIKLSEIPVQGGSCCDPSSGCC